jgi:hypothetical protein
MTVSTAGILKSHYDATRAAGDKAINSDFAFEIEGFEQNWLLCKQAPWPELSTQGEIEVPSPLGSTMWQQQQLKTAMQGPISMFETVNGAVDKMLVDLIRKGGYFNAKIYEGTPQKFLRAKRIVDCFIQLDTPDRDWENRSQVLTFSGTLFYHYFGETIEGNSGDYR